MTKILAQLVLGGVLFQAAGPADPSQVQEPEYGWDCPAMGYLRFRRELLVSTDELARMLETREVEVVHVGFDEARAGRMWRARYGDGHIPGARLLEWSEIAGPSGALEPAGSRREAFRGLGISPGRRVVLYDTGAGLEAAAAYVALDALGMAGDLALLDGHWIKWVYEGRPYSTSPECWKPGAPGPEREFAISVSSAELDELRSAGGPGYTLIDARLVAGGGGEGVRMPWSGSLVSLQYPILKGEAELRRQWRSVPARDGQRVIVAAETWWQASHAYFVAKALGYEVRILDGSIPASARPGSR